MSQQLFVSDVLIPIKEDVPVPVTYAIAEIREPDKRKGNISKTITIPGSKEVNKLFGHIFEIGIDSSFDPTLKADAVLYVDTIPVLIGSLKLDKITKINKDEIEYECILLGGVSDIITTWGDTLLETLDISEYSHPTNTKDIQWDSLDNTIRINGVDEPFELGTGYVYPIEGTGGYFSEPYTNPPIWHAADQFPAVYVKTYIDKAFDLAGFTYSSDFFDSTTFKALIIPYQYTEARRPQRTLQLDFDITLFNPGTFGLSHIIELHAEWVHKGGDTVDILLSSFSLAPLTHNFTISGNIKYDEGNVLKFYLLNTDHIDTITTKAGSSLTGTYLDTQAGQTQIGAVAGNFEVETGSDQTFTSKQYIPFDTIVSDPDSTFNTTDYTHTSPYYKLQAYAPKNVKIRDFFKALITMFNLMVMPDKYDPTLLYIEPYVDFYDSSIIFDWSSKWATDKDIVITPVPEFTTKKLTFTYKPGERDYYNDKYYTSWQEAYGQRIVNISNDYLQNEQKYELPFAPAPLIGAGGGMVFPAIVKDIPTIPTTKPNAFSGNMKILYYQGKISNGQDSSGTPYTWTHRDIDGDITRTTYGYAGHFDNPWSPAFDLNFDVCSELYYGTSNDIGANYTDNNIYNKYWSQYIDEITDKNSKLIEAWFYLTPLDILNFDFRGYVFFDKYLCKVNQIIDYNPTEQGLTKVELLTLKNGVPFVADTSHKANTGGVVHHFSENNTYQKTIENADVLNMGATPVEVVPAYGSGTIVQVVAMVATVKNASAAYATNTTLAVSYSGHTADPLITDSNILTQTSGTSIGCGTCSGGQTAYENTGVVAFIEGGNPESGDGDISITIKYRVIDIS
jgi:hypothetical protein